MRRATIMRWRSIATVTVVVGVLLLVLQSYRVATSGGLSPTTERPTCSEAAGGGFTRQFRTGESLRLERHYLPPSAICRWSGGTTAVLVSPVLGWGGFVLVGVGILTNVALRFVKPAPRRPTT